MEKINTLSAIIYDGRTIEFKGTFLNILTEGNKEAKWPFKVNVKLEDSGENIVLSSWNFDILEEIKAALYTLDVFDIQAATNIYKNENQLRLGSIKNTGETSTKKVIRIKDGNEYMKEISNIIKQYIQNPIYLTLLNELLLNNPNFKKWPAATRVHHNYPGGLAKHSLNVCKNAIAIWRTYEGSNMDIQALITGALLHDIGKLKEYKSDGSRTIYGNLVPHGVAGALDIHECCMRKGINLETKEVVILEHILLSHHEKLEFNAAVTPQILEALIVARADNMDASFEAVDLEIEQTQLNEMSCPIKSVDNHSMFKWH